MNADKDKQSLANRLAALDAQILLRHTGIRKSWRPLNEVHLSTQACPSALHPPAGILSALPLVKADSLMKIDTR